MLAYGRVKHAHPALFTTNHQPRTTNGAHSPRAPCKPATRRNLLRPMPVLVSLEHAHKAYGEQVLLADESLAITDDMKVAVVGRNGAGKSTLCKVILGKEELDSGSVNLPEASRIAYLEQHDPWSADEQVLDFLQRYTGQEDWRCGQVAGRFDIKHERLTAAIGTLSGGWQTRVKLTAMLLQEPELIVLDEPTNFLDLRTQLLLEAFLADWRGAAIIVSHDRTFLGKTCNHVCEVDRGTITLESGRIDTYFERKAEQREHLRRANAAIESKRKQLQRFIDSNRANANTASQARNKAKQLERLELHEIAEDDNRNTSIHVPRIPVRSGTALRCKGLAIGYGTKRIAEDIELELERGTRIAVVGDNGQGKTTFVNTVSGALPPIAGEAHWTHGADLGIYGQHVFGTLPDHLNVQEFLADRAPAGTTTQDILRMAGSFLFRGDDVKKPIKVLSGGERARLVLAGMLLHEHTVLVLDEPTNHLDLETVTALADALTRYQGTVLFVSHDRQFLNAVATHVIEVKDGTVRNFPGDFATYLYRVEHEHDGEEAEAAAPVPAAKEESAAERKARNRRRHELGKQIASCERRIAKYTAEDEALSAEVSTTSDQAEVQALVEKLHRVRDQLAAAEEEWLQASAALDALN